jgi:hypothetical protein
MLLAQFGGCYKMGTSALPPPAFTATAGDGRVVLNWTADPGVEYWLFAATDPSITATVWAGLANSQAYPLAVAPFYICGLPDGTQYWFAANGRVNGGPAGPSSPTISATPHYGGDSWSVNSPLSQNLYGVGYVNLTTCGNNSNNAAGNFAAVGGSSAIYTSADGVSWSSRTAPAGFSNDFFAVDGYAANLNNPANPGLRWVSVGDGGAIVYSNDGVSWIGARAYDLANPALRSLVHAGAAFVAVGDTGTILYSADGLVWTAYSSGTSANLRGVAHGAIYVAVGDNGTLLTSADGITWAAHASGTSSTLRHVTSLGSTYVAVGDNGAIVVSMDGGSTWSAQSPLAGAPSLVSVAAQSQLLAGATVVGTTVNSRFVVVDSSGNAYTSADGINWSGAIGTGIQGLNAVASSGYGFVAGANAGATAASF